MSNNTSLEIPDFLTSSAACFVHFDRDKDGALNYPEFVALTLALFQNAAGASYPIDEATLATLFGIFNSGGTGLLTRPEFETCYSEWIWKILHPVTALVVIDVQNDFIDGSLALRNSAANEEGEEVIEPINKLSSSIKWAHVAFAQDWHPANHISFVGNAGLRPLHASSPLKDPSSAKVLDVAVFDLPGIGAMEQVLWPAHCVQGSEGAKLHKRLNIPEGATIAQKGTNPDIDSYSAFWDNGKLSETKLNGVLRERGVTDVFVCGLAYDYCVGLTALHALEHGYKVTVVDDATRSLDKGKKYEMKGKIVAGGGVIVDSGEVGAMATGMDRRPELGVKLAMDLKSKGKREAVTSGAAGIHS